MAIMSTFSRFDNRWVVTMPLVWLGFGMQGCATTETEPACTWVYTPEECPDPGEAGDEVGEETNPSGQESACITAPDDTTRTLHQCHGGLTGSISFTALGKNCPQILGNPSACQELHEFGSEPYELTRVMACCDPFDDESDFDEYLTFCAADLAQQICTSVSMRIENMINDGTIPKTAESTAIQKWIASHQKECFESLWMGNMASEPGELVGSWSVPNKAAWQAVIQDFKVTIDSAAVTDVSLPDDAIDYLDCTDNGYNNTEIFESMIPSSPGIIHEFTLASAVPVSLAGPVMMGGPVNGVEFLTSLANDCAAPWCSTSTVAVDTGSGAWAIEDMTLFVNGAATLGNSSALLAIERVSVRLYGTASGTVSTDIGGAQIFEIPPRGAHFVVAGASIAGVGIYLLSNATPISAHESAAGWLFDGFVLDHVDARGETWMLTLPPTTWD